MDSELQAWLDAIPSWNKNKSEGAMIRRDIEAGIKHYKKYPYSIFNIELHGEITANEQILCKNVKAHLESKYPGWRWNVVSEHEMLWISSPYLPDPPNLKMLIHPENINKKYDVVTKLAGQMLSVHRMPCGPFRQAYLERREFDFAGNVLFPDGIPLGEKA